MPKVQLVVLNGSGGAFTAISSTMPARRVEIMEDDSVTAQGLAAKFPSDNFTQAYDYASGSQPIILGDVVANQDNAGMVLGYPAQPPAQPAAYNGGTTYQPGNTVLYADANSVTRSYTCLVANTVGIAPGVNANWTITPNWRAADTYVQLRSMTATPTTVRIVEFE